MSKVQMERCSEEEHLEYDKYSSNMYSNNQGDLLGSSSDKDVHHERIRMKKTQKYLVEICYYCIEYTAVTFLAAFMWRRPLNSVALATTTHKRPNRVSNGTCTQVKAQMVNKCRTRIVQRELYNVRDPPWGGDQKKKEKHCNSLEQNL